ncbi:MAG: hypothetical protein RL662_1944 [Bacteroidota bacterium]|jgi:putative MATE family efflux protein
MGSTVLERLEAEQPNKLLWEYSIPAIVGSLVVALYNLIDSVYIGHGPGLGDHAIGGIGIIFPIMTLITAVGFLVGTGAASRVSIFLGSGDKASAESVLGNAFSLSISLTLLLIFFLYLFLEPILLAIGATDDTYPFAYEFMLYYLPCNLFLNLSFTLSSVMRASGYPKKAMYAMLAGVIANLILAPIFIFGLEWGMKGAAIATCLSTIVSVLPILHHFFNKNSTLKFYWANTKLRLDTTKSILSIGFAQFVIQLAASVVVFFINNRLRLYGGSLAIEAYTIVNRLTLIIILVIVGLTQGMQPIIGYNYGAKRMDRVIATVNYAIKVGIAIGFVGLVVVSFFAERIVSVFNPTPALADESVQAIRIVTIMLPLSGLQMVISSFFQSIGMPMKATILSLTRQFIFLVPILFILSYYFKLLGVWATIPLSDFLSTLLAIIIYIYQIRKLDISKSVIN